MLDQIKVPAMGMYGDRDKVVHPKQWQPMQKGIPQALIERFPTCGHFPMLEEPKQFTEKLKQFLDQEEFPHPLQQSVGSPNPIPSVTLAP